MPGFMDIVKVKIDRKIIDRKDWIKYLVLVNWHARNLGDLIEWKPDSEFDAFVENQVEAYLNGEMPDASIQSAVMNIADDFMTGGQVSLKAGDFIALQDSFRQQRKGA